jgi:hypothetical protein
MDALSSRNVKVALIFFPARMRGSQLGGEFWTQG